MEEAKPIQEGEHKQRRMLETCIDQNHFPIHHGLAWAGIVMGTLRCICQNQQVLFCNGLRREDECVNSKHLYLLKKVNVLQ